MQIRIGTFDTYRYVRIDAPIDVSVRTVQTFFYGFYETYTYRYACMRIGTHGLLRLFALKNFKF